MSKVIDLRPIGPLNGARGPVLIDLDLQEAAQLRAILDSFTDGIASNGGTHAYRREYELAKALMRGLDAVRGEVPTYRKGRKP